MSQEIKLSKPWMTISELAKHWHTEIEALLYRASLGELIVGVLDYGNSHSKRPPIGGEAPFDYEGDLMQCEFIGVLSLSADDVERLAINGEALVVKASLHRAWGTQPIIFDEPRSVKLADVVVPMIEVVKHDGQIADELAKQGGVLSEKKEATLLKQIGALALAIANKSTAYKIGEKPNMAAIADAAINAVETLSAKTHDNLNVHGLSSSNIRGNIKKGLDLLEGV
jgi:hypothetical protein